MDKCKWFLNFDDPTIDGFYIECQHGTRIDMGSLPNRKTAVELERLLKQKEKLCNRRKVFRTAEWFKNNPMTPEELEKKKNEKMRSL